MTTIGGLHRKMKGLRVKHKQQTSLTTHNDKETRIDDNRPLREIDVNRSIDRSLKVEYVMNDDPDPKKPIPMKAKTLDVNVSVAMLKLTGIVSYCPSNPHVLGRDKRDIITAFVSFRNVYPGMGNKSMETFVPSLPIESICRNEKIDYYFAVWNENNQRRSNQNKAMNFPLTLQSNKGNKRHSDSWTRSSFIPYILEIQIGLIHAGEMIKLGQSLLAIDGEAVDKTFYLPVHPDQDESYKKNTKTRKSKHLRQVWKKGFSLDKNPTLLMHLKVELPKTTKQVSFTEIALSGEDSDIFEGISDDNTISEMSENDAYLPKGILKSFDVNQIYKDPNYQFKYDEYSSHSSNVSFWSSEYTDEEDTRIVYQPVISQYQVCNGVSDTNSICDSNSDSSLPNRINIIGQNYLSLGLCGACKF